jgi:hypothetical protein
MFKKSSGKINLTKTFRKILYLYPAFNDTYVFLGVAGLRQDCVVHVDSKGNILFQHIFPIPMDTAGMLSDKEFILLETRTKWYLGPEGAE